MQLEKLKLELGPAEDSNEEKASDSQKEEVFITEAPTH